MNDRTIVQGLTSIQKSLLAVFALSGFTGLIYESIWAQYLKLFLGHAAYAQTLVLAIFMGGMAIGAEAAGRWTTRLGRPLVVYAVIELLLGALALLFDREFRVFLAWCYSIAIPAATTPLGIASVKWLGGTLLILPQSILLGMTFPLISSGLMRVTPRRSGQVIALLYFANCLGAACGVLVSGFYLVPSAGLPGTLLAAGALNIMVAAVAWALGRRQQVEAAAGSVLDAQPLVPLRQWFHLVAFGTGLASFAYEVAWIRMLSLVLGSSTHSFELMLAAFIFGLAAGGLWIRRRIDQDRDPMASLGRILLVIGSLAAMTIAGWYFSFDVMAWAKSAFSPTEAGYLGFNLTAQALAMALMVPVTFFAGATLPLITHAFMSRGAGERAVGSIYAWNTLGCIVGTLLAVHVLMPGIGLKGTILAGSVVSLALGFSSLALSKNRLGAPGTRAIAVVSIAAVAWVALAITPDPRRTTSAVYRTGNAQAAQGTEILYLRDGRTATISLVRRGDFVTIATNGKPDASIQMGQGKPAIDEITMILAAALPLSLHPAPRNVANIGIGSGLTSSVLLSTDAVSFLTSIEIEPFMVDAARQGFVPRVSRTFDDARSRIVIEDAKTFFAASRIRFDVIVSEPSNPWVSGVSTLFSDEFYSQIAGHLAPGGLLVQWLQIYETDLSIVMSVLKALSPHFADYVLYNVNDSNLLVVARRDLSIGAPSSRIFSWPALNAELDRAGIDTVDDLTSRRVGDKRLLEPFVNAYPVPVNSDYFPFVDQAAPRLRFMNGNALPLIELSMLPVPFLELALPAWTTGPAKPRPRFGLGYRVDLVDRARRIAAGIDSGDLGWMPGEVARSATTLDMPRSQCMLSGHRQAWLASVWDLGQQTSAYLPYRDTEPMWRLITSSGCYSSLTPDERVWVDFQHAVAMRDRITIVRLALAQMDSPRLRDQSDKAGYVLTAAAAAMYGSGDARAVRDFLGRWLPLLRPSKEYGLALQVLAAAGEAG